MRRRFEGERRMKIAKRSLDEACGLSRYACRLLIGRER